MASFSMQMLTQDISKAMPKLDKAKLRRAMRRACKKLRDYARTHHKFESNTGKLRGSVRYKTEMQESDSLIELRGTVYIKRSDFNGNRPYFEDVMEGRSWIAKRTYRYLAQTGKPQYRGRYYTIRQGQRIVIPEDNFIENAFDEKQHEVEDEFLEATRDLVW